MADDRRFSAADVPVTAEEVAHRGFATAFRGFDANEVRQYLVRVAESLRNAKDRQRELEQAVRDAEARAAKPHIDEATLTSALGEHTSRIIRSAHEAAAEIRGGAEQSVEQILRDAHEEASKLRAEAERALADRVSEAEAEAHIIRQTAEADVNGIRRRAQEQADRLLERARVQSKEVALEASALRNRVMGDLMRRRRVALVQVEQLQAGRDRLLEAYRVVRRTLDEATDALERAEADARAAAEAAAHRVAAEPEPSPADLGITEPAPVEAEDIDIEAEPAVRAEVTPVAVYSRPPDSSSSVRVLRREDEPAAAASDDEPVVERPSLKIVQPPSDVESVRVIRGDDVHAPEPEPAPLPEPVAVAAAEPEPAEPEPEPQPEPARSSGDYRPVETENRPANVDADELFAKLRAEQDAEEPAAEAEAAPPAASAEDELLEKRDEALAPITAALTRRLKRALQDEQNEVLDRLRRSGGNRPSLVVAFPAEIDQRQRYRDAGRDPLADAIAAGSAWAGGKATADDILRSVTDELADAVVGPLARKLEHALDEAASMGEDDGAITSRVSAAYRDLKGARLERLSADVAGSAYAAGAFGAWEPGTPLRWIVRDVDGECPDCDDNALAGPTPRGEAFPTGQLRPPAHAGCRCLLAPFSA